MRHSKRIINSANFEDSNGGQGSREITKMMSQLKNEISVGRKLLIQERIKQNRKVNEGIVSGLIKVASGKDASDDGSFGDMLDRRMENPSLPGSGYRNTLIGKCPPTSAIKIPYVEKLPPYTSYVPIRKNKKMVDGQTMVGRRSIYYDPKVQVVNNKFREEDDRVLRIVIQKFELSEEVLQNLTQLVQGTIEEIQERCSYLKEKDQNAQEQDLEVLEESLDEATRAFEYIFCRRCKVFDCCLHGVGQDNVYPVKKQPYSHEPDSDGSKKPCGKNCYIQLEVLKHPEECHSVDPIHGKHSSKSKTFHSNGVRRVYSRKRRSIAGDSTKTVEKRRYPVESEGEGITDYISGPKQQRSNAIGRSLSRGSEWRPLEKDLLLKGIEIFGRNSCFITRNLLSGMKTCMEVFNYMNVEIMPSGSNANEVPCTEDQGENGEERTGNFNLDSTVQVKKSSFCEEAKSREHKQLLEQTSHPRIGDGKLEKQYIPCRCPGACGRNCSCRLNGTCCEKYCGCSKSCKRKFKGCRCTKNLCKTRHCPCFASNRECDPDLCKNCWISCGDVSQGEPSEKVEILCDNMKFLLNSQRKGILLGRSDVSGWGAFVKTSVEKNEYLGEYVGEVIPHNEADRRGPLYKKIGRSYLFNLNDQYAIDSYHFGNKLKFANHSYTSNCSAKIMLVNGDHRIGIFTNRRMEAGEEIFYDYGPQSKEMLNWHSRRGKKAPPKRHAQYEQERKETNNQDTCQHLFSSREFEVDDNVLSSFCGILI